jgi:septal ring factor EnvC (AmiA/AmiB activator)
MAEGKHKNISYRNQSYLASSEPNSPTIASPGYTITPEKQAMDLKSLLMMMMENYKKDINNSLKEIQENTSKQVKELDKSIQFIQDLKMEVETIKKSQREITLEIENLGKKSGAMDASISNKIQEIGEGNSGAEDTIENIDTTVKENAKCRKNLFKS